MGDVEHEDRETFVTTYGNSNGKSIMRWCTILLSSHSQQNTTSSRSAKMPNSVASSSPYLAICFDWQKMGRRTALDQQPLRTKRDCSPVARVQGDVERETEEVDKNALTMRRGAYALRGLAEGMTVERYGGMRLDVG